MRSVLPAAAMAVAVAASVSPSRAAQGSGLAPAWAVSPETIWPTGAYAEGPVFDAEGALYVSYPGLGRVDRLGRDGTETRWLEGVDGANGHLVLDDGTHLLASRPRVMRLDADGAVLEAVDSFEGAEFVFPNDLATDGSGGFWFTDSGSRTADTGALYHVDAGWTVRRLADGLAFPNGLLLSRDGATLYVSQSRANDLLAFDVGPDGAVSGQRVLIELPPEGIDQAKSAPDGMCADARGNLHVAHNGTGRLRVVSPDGKLLASYRTGLLTLSNCTFGPDGAAYLTGGVGFETGPGAVVRLSGFADAPGAAR